MGLFSFKTRLPVFEFSDEGFMELIDYVNDLEGPTPSNSGRHKDVLRQITDLLIRADQEENSGIFDLFLEHYLLDFYFIILNSDSAIDLKAELLRSISMLVGNIKYLPFKLWLLSSNHINDFIMFFGSWEDHNEETLGYFLSFCSIVSNMIFSQPEYVSLFCTTTKSFPLFTDTLIYLNHVLDPVKNKVREIITNLLLSNSSTISYFLINYEKEMRSNGQMVNLLRNILYKAFYLCRVSCLHHDFMHGENQLDSVEIDVEDLFLDVPDSFFDTQKPTELIIEENGPVWSQVLIEDFLRDVYLERTLQDVGSLTKALLRLNNEYIDSLDFFTDILSSKKQTAITLLFRDFFFCHFYTNLIDVMLKKLSDYFSVSYDERKDADTYVLQFYVELVFNFAFSFTDMRLKLRCFDMLKLKFGSNVLLMLLSYLGDCNPLLKSILIKIIIRFCSIVVAVFYRNHFMFSQEMHTFRQLKEFIDAENGKEPLRRFSSVRSVNALFCVLVESIAADDMDFTLPLAKSLVESRRSYYKLVKLPIYTQENVLTSILGEFMLSQPQLGVCLALTRMLMSFGFPYESFTERMRNRAVNNIVDIFKTSRELLTTIRFIASMRNFENSFISTKEVANMPCLEWILTDCDYMNTISTVKDTLRDPHTLEESIKYALEYFLLAHMLDVTYRKSLVTEGELELTRSDFELHVRSIIKEDCYVFLDQKLSVNQLLGPMFSGLDPNAQWERFALFNGTMLVDKKKVPCFLHINLTCTCIYVLMPTNIKHYKQCVRESSLLDSEEDVEFVVKHIFPMWYASIAMVNANRKGEHLQIQNVDPILAEEDKEQRRSILDTQIQRLKRIDSQKSLKIKKNLVSFYCHDVAQVYSLLQSQISLTFNSIISDFCRDLGIPSKYKIDHNGSLLIQ
ncbi:hypothetical protein PCE1_000886 [Barthelona sp. PCE]